MAAFTDLAELLKANPTSESFKPYCYRSDEADAVTFKLRQDPDYSVRLTDHVTLFRSIDTDELTGVRIKGFTSLVEDLPNYLKVSHDGIKLSIFFWSFRGAVADENTRKELNELAKAAEDIMVPETCGA
jgi:hypothetical protein